jgi:O-antigen/teichoic acid export membrane protein
MFTGIATGIVDSGFSVALIHRQDVTLADESTVFWFNLGVGTIASIVLLLMAPIIARIFQLPVLIPLTAVMALNVLLGSLGSIHATLLTKKLDFRALMKAGAISTVVSGIIASAMAYRGFGVWALATQVVVSTAVSTVCLWILSGWRPQFTFRRDTVHRYFGFGGYLLASSILDMAYARIWTVLIGKFFSVKDLGLYSRAESTKQVPVGTLTGVLARVTLPVFSTAAENKERLRRGVKLALRSIMLINVPMMLGLAVVAEPLFQTIFGDKWSAAVPFFQVLCIGGILYPLQVINLNVLTAQGHSKLFFRLEIIKLALGLGLLAIGAWFGVMGIAWSQVAMSVLGFGINAYYTKRHLNYGAIAQFVDVLPVMAVSIPMVVGAWWLHSQLRLSPVFMLVGLSGFGALVFFAASWIFRLNALAEIVDLFRGRRPEIT